VALTVDTLELKTGIVVVGTTGTVVDVGAV
jgi:hypothetical protein